MLLGHCEFLWWESTRTGLPQNEWLAGDGWPRSGSPFGILPVGRQLGLSVAESTVNRMGSKSTCRCGFQLQALAIDFDLAFHLNATHKGVKHRAVRFNHLD